MLVHFRDRASPEEMDLDRFEELAREGIVSPSSLIRDRVLTNDEWWTADNLRLFHRNTGWRHPVGTHLAPQLAREQEKAEDGRRLSEHFKEYNTGTFIQKTYGLRGVDEMAAPPDVIGICRLTIRPAFFAETVWTIVVRERTLELEAVRGKVSLWYAGLTEPEATTDMPQLQRDEAVISIEAAPEIFRDFPSFLRLARDAGDCSSPVHDGISYLHQISSRGVRIEARWDNPGTFVVVTDWSDAVTTYENVPQCNLIEQYRDCMRRSGIHLQLP